MGKGKKMNGERRKRGMGKGGKEEWGKGKRRNGDRRIR